MTTNSSSQSTPDTTPRLSVRQITLSKEALFIMGTMALTLLVALASARFHWGPRSAFYLAFGMYAAIALFAWRFNDRYLKTLLVFGLVAGVVELAADNWLVNVIRSLVYPSGEPMFWASPAYMPFAWAVVLIQVGYLGWLYSKSHSMKRAMALSFVIGMCFIPVFETCAKYALWWYYQPYALMVLNTPLYIVLGEGLIALALPLIFSRAVNQHYGYAVMAGIGQGLWIFVSYALFYKLLALL